MSADSSSPVSRAGRRALIRQSQCDLRSDSIASGSSNPGWSSSSSSNVAGCDDFGYPNASVSNLHSSTPLKRMRSAAETDSETLISSSPNDEACFVDFQQKQVDFIATLPPEIATYILSNLPHHSDVLACTLVSKSWSSLCHDSQIWKRLFESRAKDGWKLVKDVRSTWRAIMAISAESDEQLYEETPSRSDAQPLSTRRGRCVLVDECPLPSSSTSQAGDTSIDSLEYDLTRTTIQADRGDTDGMDWYAIYRARFFLTKRWSLADGEPEPATLNSSWGTNSYASSTSAGSWSINDHDEISLKWGENRSRNENRNENSFEPTDKHLAGHSDSVYCVRFDHRPFELPLEVANSLQARHRSGPLYDQRTSLGLGSYGKIVSGSRDQTIRVWDGDSGICLHTLRGHVGSVLCLEYDDEYLFSASSDQTVIVWDLRLMKSGLTPIAVRRIRGHSSGILDLAIDDRWLITCGKDTTVRVHDRSNGCRLTLVYNKHDGPINAGTLARSPRDGKTKAVTVSGDGGVQLWDVESGDIIRNFVGHSKGLACVKFFDNYIATGSNDATVRVWDADTGHCLCICKGHQNLVRAIGFDPRRKMILSGGYDGKVKLFYLGRELHPNAILSSEGSPAEASWDIDAGHEARVFDVQMDVTRILCCGEDNKICIRDFGQAWPLMRLFV